MATSPKTPGSVADRVLQRSLQVLKAGQAPSGALIASPDFGVYRYAWLRDGAFCAHALDIAGEHDAARAWHRWVGKAIDAHAPMIEAAIESVEAGHAPNPAEMPPARYTLDGALETESGDIDPWPNFQLDGYGMWLWSLLQHLGDAALPAELAPAVELTARYLASCGRVPCWNCWEEYDGGEHASTLAAVAAGLRAAAQLTRGRDAGAAADDVRAELERRYVVDGRFKRGANDDGLDGSLAWLAVPFGVFDVHDPRVVKTIEALRADLAGPGGGIYRFRGDTYYGGGQWLLLTSSLAWHDAVAGNRDAATRAQEWVRRQAEPNGDLPEQVSDHAQTAAMVAPWIERWGQVASPLLWSHAMYLITEDALA